MHNVQNVCGCIGHRILSIRENQMVFDMFDIDSRSIFSTNTMPLADLKICLRDVRIAL